MSAGLAPEDVIAAAGFFAVLLGWGGYATIRQALSDGARARIRRRAQAVGDTEAAANRAKTEGRKRQRASASQAGSLLDEMWRKIEQAGGMQAKQGLLAAISCGGVAAAVVAHSALKTPGWLTLLVALAAAAASGLLGYSWLTARFRRRFVEGFPDALDLVIRAVRAGVPVNSAIETAGDELADPVRSEFKQMGNALKLGIDQDHVMQAAIKRVNVPELSFFTVCLRLQRETGGALAETLENLASIIRTRREIGMKTKALTAQCRAASNIIAVVPFACMAALWAISPNYVKVLTDTPAGNRLLGLSLAMIIAGLVIVHRMARLGD